MTKKQNNIRFKNKQKYIFLSSKIQQDPSILWSTWQGFHYQISLMVQNDYSSSNHHVSVPVKGGRKKKAILSPVRTYPTHWPKFSQNLATKETLKIVFIHKIW